MALSAIDSPQVEDNRMDAEIDCSPNEEITSDCIDWLLACARSAKVMYNMIRRIVKFIIRLSQTYGAYL